MAVIRGSKGGGGGGDKGGNRGTEIASVAYMKILLALTEGKLQETLPEKIFISMARHCLMMLATKTSWRDVGVAQRHGGSGLYCWLPGSRE